MCLTRPGDTKLASWPPFCSNLSIELWSSRDDGRGDEQSARSAELQDAYCAGGDLEALAEDDRHVRCVYNGQVVQMRCAPADQPTCTLREFRRMLHAFRVDDLSAVCSDDEAEGDDGVGITPAFNR